jgi:7-carboxy-7-deazaguanine synthase
MLRVSEFYTSIQGEGPNVGRPTIFLRFAGCNLKCAGWACDTQHAIDPAIFTKEQVKYEPEKLAKELIKLQVPNICLTGGEPFLQARDGMLDLLKHLYKLHTASVEVEVFTNGTREIPKVLRTYIHNIILDWKLPGSGENLRLLEATVFDNIRLLNSRDAIKFTIADRNDYELAKERFYEFLATFRGVVFCGPVWGKIDSRELVEWMLKDNMPWFLNTQLHKYIWDPDERRT